MWLKFGIAPNGELKNIDEVGGGKSNLTCLYCGGKLTAKKGNVKQHHFAHTNETCKLVTARIKAKSFPSLPLYDRFNIQLSGEDLERLKVLWQNYGTMDIPIPRDLVNFNWILKKLIAMENDASCHFTDLGKIPVAALSLALFNQVQEPLLLSELAKYQRAAQFAKAASLSSFDEKLADYRIYRAQLRRILLNSLYFLEIKTTHETFYKIGITTRDIDERLLEIHRDLEQHYSNAIINLLGLWSHRGNVELYFKYRYKPFNYRIGKLTEYFRFPDVKTILKDLNQMESKVLSEVEREIVGEVDDKSM